MDILIFYFLHLRYKVLSNKTGQGIGITWVENKLVVQEYKMEVMGHQDSFSYDK